MSLEDQRSEGLARAAAAKERLWDQAHPRPIPLAERRVIAEEDTHVGAGRDKTSEKRTRSLTTAEQMHRNGSLTYDEWQTAGVLRTYYMEEMGGSEGVSSYGQSTGGGNPWNKADRKAASILLRNRTNRRALADMMFAMVGSYDEEGNKIFDKEMAVLLVRAVIETVDTVTLGQIGAARTMYTGEKQKPAAGGAILKEYLRRGAAHLRYVKAQEWRDSTSWKVV